MVRAKQPNMERFAGSIASLVGDTSVRPTNFKKGFKNPKKKKFVLDRKAKRNLDKQEKKDKQVEYKLKRSQPKSDEPKVEKPKKPEKPTKKSKKEKKDTRKNKKKEKNSRDIKSITSLQSEAYKDAPEDNKLTKEEANAANKKEDRLIKDMENRLGIRKNKKGKVVPASFDEDGLGYVLHFKDDVPAGLDGAGVKECEKNVDDLFGDLDGSGDDMEGSEFDDDIGDEDIGDDISDEDIGHDISDDEEGFGEKDEDFGEDGSEGEVDIMDTINEEGEGQDEVPEMMNDSVVSDEEKEKDKEEVVKGSYVPPHLRNLTSVDLLNRKVKGFVNRVTCANLSQILSNIDELYATHPRHDVNTSIIKTVLEGCLISSIMPARLCAEHMLLIAALSANIGPEFVSPLLETLALKFTENQVLMQGKVVNNVVSMLCFLYSLKVVSCVLIFDVIKVLLKSFTEEDLEILLYILKSVGIDIRKEDPQALKDIISTVNEASAKVIDKSTRFQWFIETLTAVKNNNVAKIPNYDKSDIEDIRKTFKSVVKANPPNLQLTLLDLHNAETKGRWWLVGAAWVGREETDKADPLKFDSKLLQLARKNHMNTDVRRNLFCIIMSSEDYNDCYEKIIKLSLKDKQQREIIHVAFICALKVKTFNPYYTSIIKTFCESSKSFQITCQFAIWDRLKELDKLSETKKRNFCSVLTSLLSTKSVSLSVLKIVNFAEIEAKDVEFYKDLFTKLLDMPEMSVAEVFGRLQPLPLDSLKNGIKVFLKCFVKQTLSDGHKKNMKIACKCI